MSQPYQYYPPQQQPHHHSNSLYPYGLQGNISSHPHPQPPSSSYQQQQQQQHPPQYMQIHPRPPQPPQPQQQPQQQQHSQHINPPQPPLIPQDPPIPIIEMLKRDEFFGPSSDENLLIPERVSKGYFVSSIVEKENQCSLIHNFGDSQSSKLSFLNPFGKPDEINKLVSLMTKTIYQINYQHKIDQNDEFIIGKKRQRTQYYEDEDEWETSNPEAKRPSSYVRKLGTPSHTNAKIVLENALLRSASLYENGFKFPFFTYDELFSKQKELVAPFYRSLLFLSARLIISRASNDQEPLGKLLGMMYNEYARSDTASVTYLSFFLNYCFREGMFTPGVLFMKLKRCQNSLKAIGKVTKMIEKQCKLCLENKPIEFEDDNFNVYNRKQVNFGFSQLLFNLDDAYNKVKYSDLISQLQDYFQDSFDEMILLICEWAVTDQRIEFQNRDMYVATLFNKILSLPPKTFPPQSLFYSMSSSSSISNMFQKVAYHFIDNYEFKSENEKLSMVKLLASLSRFDLFSYYEYIKTLICLNKLSSHAYFVENTPCVLRVTPETLIPLLGKGPRLARDNEEAQRDALIATRRVTRKQAQARLEALLLSETPLTSANVQEFVSHFRTLNYHDKVYVSDWLTDTFFVKSCLCKRAGDRKVLCFCAPDVRRFRLALVLLEESQNYVALASFLLRVLKSPRYATELPILLQAVLSVLKNATVFYILDSVPRVEAVLEALHASVMKKFAEEPVFAPLLAMKVQDTYFVHAAQDTKFPTFLSAPPSAGSEAFEELIVSHDFPRTVATLNEDLGNIAGLVKALLARVKAGTDIAGDAAFFVGLFDAAEGDTCAYALAESFFVNVGACTLDQNIIDFLCAITLDPGAAALRTFVEPYRVIDLISNVSVKKAKLQPASGTPVDAGLVAMQRLRALLKMSEFVTSWKSVRALLNYVASMYGSNCPTPGTVAAQFPQELGTLFADKRAKVKHILCGQFEYFMRMFQKHGFFRSDAYMAVMQSVMDSELPEELRGLSTAQAISTIFDHVAAADGPATSLKWQFGLILSYLVFNLYRDAEATKDVFVRTLFLKLFGLAESSGSSYVRASVSLNVYASMVNIMGEDTQTAFMEVVKDFISNISFTNPHSISDFILKIKQNKDDENEQEDIDVCLTFGDILAQTVTLILSPSQNLSKGMIEATNVASAVKNLLTELNKCNDNTQRSEEYLFITLKILESCLLSLKKVLQNPQQQQQSSTSSTSSSSSSSNQAASVQERLAGLSELVSVLTESIAHHPVVSDMSGGITSLVIRCLCALLALFPADRSNILKKGVRDTVLHKMAGVTPIKRESVFRAMVKEGLFNEERTQKEFMSYSSNVVNRFAPAFLQLNPQTPSSSSSSSSSPSSSSSSAKLPPSCKVLSKNEKFIYELYNLDEFFQYSFPKAVSIYGVKKSHAPKTFYEDKDDDEHVPQSQQPQQQQPQQPSMGFAPHMPSMITRSFPYQPSQQTFTGSYPIQYGSQPSQQYVNPYGYAIPNSFTGVFRQHPQQQQPPPPPTSSSSSMKN